MNEKVKFITIINSALKHLEVKNKLKDFIIALGKELSGENQGDIVSADMTVQTVK